MQSSRVEAGPVQGETEKGFSFVKASPAPAKESEEGQKPVELTGILPTQSLAQTPRPHCGRRLREAQEWPALQPHQQRCHSLLRRHRESTRVLNRMRHPALPAVQEINSRGLDEPRLLRRHLPMLPGEPEASPHRAETGR